MKHFIKDALIIVCILIFLTSLFQSGGSKQASISKAIESSIIVFEDNINSHVIIDDSNIVEDYDDLSKSDNIFGKIGYFLSKIVISIVNGIIKIILFVVERIV